VKFKRISEVSQETGLTLPQLRYLHRIGLVRPLSTGVHRRYTEAQVGRLRQIKALLERGFRPNQLVAIFVGPGVLPQVPSSTTETIYEELFESARRGWAASIALTNSTEYNTTYKLLRRMGRRKGLGDLTLTKRGSTLEVRAARAKPGGGAKTSRGKRRRPRGPK
jgi:DNA-binding transcriptional MerR regulator